MRVEAEGVAGGAARARAGDLASVWIWAAAILFLVLWFHALGARTLMPTDEARYAEIAREMAASGDFVTSRLNGIKYYGKPPLQAWMTALSFRAFGIGEWQARLWTGLCGLFGIALVVVAGAAVFNRRTGFIAGLVLASMFYWNAGGHIASCDMGLAAMMTLALCALLLAQRPAASPAARRNWMLVCWAGMALAVMTKGLVGIVLPGLVLVAYTLLAGDRAIWTRLHLRAGLALFLLIAVPWFVVASIRNPEFPYFFFIREHVLRYATNVHAREKAWYYFVPLLLAGVLPWLAALPGALRLGLRERGTGFRPHMLLLVWTGVIFVFFSLSRAKLPAYILPLFPALALLIACHLDRAGARAIRGVAALFAAACLLTALLVLLVLLVGRGGDAQEMALYQVYARWIWAAALVGGVASVLAMRRARVDAFGAIAALAAGAFLAGYLALVGHEPLGREKAGVAHLAVLRAELDARTDFYSVGMYEYALPFYLQRKMTLVAYAADGMVLGLKQEPWLWVPDIEQFIARWQAAPAQGRKAVAVVTGGAYATLQERGVPMRVLARDRRRIVIASDAGALRGADSIEDESAPTGWKAGGGVPPTTKAAMLD